MSESTTPETLPHHLERLAADANDVKALLTAHHDENGDIHPEALAKSARLATSLAEVVRALTQHDHLAMDADDIWSALTIKHDQRDDGTLT